MIQLLEHSWKRRAVALGIAVTLAAGGTLLPLERVHAAASTSASAQAHSAVFNRFEHLVKKPSTLGLARNYLINRIDEVNRSEATIMTLHLENAQKAHLNAFAEKLYPERIQRIVDKAYRVKGSTGYEALLSVITDKETRKILMEARDKGYRIDTGEGMYYPIMDYQGYMQFRSAVNPDIADYIKLMAVESNEPMIYDAAIAVSWDEVLKRTAGLEEFVKKYPRSNRAAAVKNAFALAKSRSFYGASNTPAYIDEGSTSKLDPELRDAYEAAVADSSRTSDFLKAVEELLSLLDSTGNVRTEEVDRFLEKHAG